MSRRVVVKCGILSMCATGSNVHIQAFNVTDLLKKERKKKLSIQLVSYHIKLGTFVCERSRTRASAHAPQLATKINNLFLSPAPLPCVERNTFLLFVSSRSESCFAQFVFHIEHTHTPIRNEMNAKTNTDQLVRPALSLAKMKTIHDDWLQNKWINK